MRTKFITIWLVSSCLILGVCIYIISTGVAKENDIRIAGQLLRGNFILITIAAVWDFLAKTSTDGKDH